MQITLRLSESMHAKVRERARALGRSVNSYLVHLVSSDLELPESRVPAETPRLRKSPVMVDAEALLAWSLEHEAEEPDDETLMREFGWTERMIPIRRSLFKALCRKDLRFREARENFLRKIYNALADMSNVFRNINDFDRKSFCERLKISEKYLDVVLKALEARDAIILKKDIRGKETILIRFSMAGIY